MNDYIRNRIRADAARTIQLGKAQSVIQHSSLRGRFRELLVDNLIAPWLPPYAQCGTGVIVDAENRSRQSTQEDIIIFDKSLMPSVLLSPNAQEGVFPINSVLARIEVKSVLTRTELRGAIEAAAEIQLMKFAARTDATWGLPIGVLFAYDSDLVQNSDSNAEWNRMMELNRELDLLFSSKCPNLPGPISCLCVVGRGCWAYGGTNDGVQAQWLRATMSEHQPLEEVLLFAGALSNSCFSLHAERQGRDPRIAAAGGIGNFILSYDTYEPVKK